VRLFAPRELDTAKQESQVAERAAQEGWPV